MKQIQHINNKNTIIKYTITIKYLVNILDYKLHFKNINYLNLTINKIIKITLYADYYLCGVIHSKLTSTSTRRFI